MDSNELTRLLLNLIRKGSIAAVDHATKKCRVNTGDLVSNWLPWNELRAGATRTWNPPTVGEQVLLLCPGGDPAAGVVLCGLFSDAHPAPANSGDLDHTAYPDGAVIEYDHAAHALKATLPAGGTVEIIAPASVSITTQDATITADTVTIAAQTANINADTVTIDASSTTCNGDLDVNGIVKYVALVQK